MAGGYFYKVKFDDAIILHFLLNYKIVDYQVVIFPRSALDTVEQTLKKYSINFEVARELVYRFIPNNYEPIKLKAYESLDKELRINNIVKKLKLCTEISQIIY